MTDTERAQYPTGKVSGRRCRYRRLLRFAELPALLFVAIVCRVSGLQVAPFQLGLRRSIHLPELRYSTTLLSQESSYPTDTSPSMMEHAPVLASSSRAVVDKSTLVLLEHVNLNVPVQRDILNFYFNILDCGMDPRKSENLFFNANAKKKTIWANAGASQFHLPFGETPQIIPGHVGLRMSSLEDLVDRLQSQRGDSEDPVIWYKDKSKAIGDTGRPSVVVKDPSGNVFVCRESQYHEAPLKSTADVPVTLRQPIIGPAMLKPEASTEKGEEMTFEEEVAVRFGKSAPDCVGIEYVEFWCQPGTAARIAQFYETLFDATTTVHNQVPFHDPIHYDSSSNPPVPSDVAMIAFGNVYENGQSDQCLLFREIPEELQGVVQRPSVYDGHHIALYVGSGREDFAVAFNICNRAGIVWVNPRFSDKATTLHEAVHKYRQFRFKDIIDVESGEVVSVQAASPGYDLFCLLFRLTRAICTVLTIDRFMHPDFRA
jgi:hypothetical protein